MKIPVGHGAYLEPDEEPRRSPHHMEIVKTWPINKTHTRHWAILSCGHRVMMFGRLELAEGRVLCTECRDAGTPSGV